MSAFEQKLGELFNFWLTRIQEQAADLDQMIENEGKECECGKMYHPEDIAKLTAMQKEGIIKIMIAVREQENILQVKVLTDEQHKWLKQELLKLNTGNDAYFILSYK